MTLQVLLSEKANDGRESNIVGKASEIEEEERVQILKLLRQSG